ncbi:MAG: hypothetical protein EOO01_34235, partial [Chitinophagaceae bacterium]
LYGAMLERIKLAGGTLRGVLWYQGESDADPVQSATYEERFESWVHALRADTGISDLPVIVVQLSRVVNDAPPESHQSWDRHFGYIPLWKEDHFFGYGVRSGLMKIYPRNRSFAGS